MLKEVKCNICNSDSYRILYKASSKEIEAKGATYMITNEAIGSSLQIIRCSRCGLIYVSPRPAVRSLLSNYINFVDEMYMEEEVAPDFSELHSLKAILPNIFYRSK